MPKINKNSKMLPAAVEKLLAKIGSNIHTARIRRNMRLVDLAEKVGVSRYLIADVEKGKSTVAIGTYISVLWALGLTTELNDIADPDSDSEGKALENARAPGTAAKRKKVLDNDF